jgi:HEAT repeat protein
MRGLGLSLTVVPALLACGVCSLLVGCDVFDMKPGAKSIFQAFAPPTPEEAARWATDEFDADKRYRGTLLLANAPFAGDPLYIKLFTQNMNDTDPGVRSAAARGLGAHGGPEHVPLLVAHLTDEDPIVRIESARALQRLHNPVAIDPLLNALDMDKELEPRVRVEAASALSQYPETRVVDELIKSLRDDNLAVNRSSQDALRTLTGQDFGFDLAAWQAWASSTGDLFAARTVYIYPVFARSKKWYEHLPLVSGPPNETPGIPAGMTPGTVD